MKACKHKQKKHTVSCRRFNILNFCKWKHARERSRNLTQCSHHHEGKTGLDLGVLPNRHGKSAQKQLTTVM
jgi:hypothetical protein